MTLMLLGFNDYEQTCLFSYLPISYAVKVQPTGLDDLTESDCNDNFFKLFCYISYTVHKYI